MGKRLSSDDDWPWWPGDADNTLPFHPEDEEEPEAFFEPLRGTIVPAAPPFLERASRGGQPLARSGSSRQAERQRRLIRIIAPLLMLGLVALLVVVIRLPDAASAQPTITQSSSVSVSSASPAVADIQAYIVGEVVHPGVYPLHSGDRVDALLHAAGGPKPDADLARVNLAALVTDGEEVYLHAQKEPS